MGVLDLASAVLGHTAQRATGRLALNVIEIIHAIDRGKPPAVRIGPGALEPLAVWCRMNIVDLTDRLPRPKQTRTRTTKPTCDRSLQKGQFRRMSDNKDNEDATPAVVWGHSILEPDRGHMREPETHVIDGDVVGFAICGAWLVGDLPDQEGDFPKCSACLALLDEPPP